MLLGRREERSDDRPREGREALVEHETVAEDELDPAVRALGGPAIAAVEGGLRRGERGSIPLGERGHVRARAAREERQRLGEAAAVDLDELRQPAALSRTPASFSTSNQKRTPSLSNARTAITTNTTVKPAISSSTAAESRARVQRRCSAANRGRSWAATSSAPAS